VRIAAIATAAVLVLAAGCASNGLAPVGASRHPAPGFSLPSLDGRQIELSELRGKVIVLDFWATWCTPCLAGLPHLQSMAGNGDMAQRGLVVLAVNEREKRESVRPIIDAAHYTFTVAQDADGSVGQAYLVFTLPTTIVVGRDGLVDAVVSGWTQDTTRQIDDAVTHALDAPIR
jgi:thiol-disulfide isomerase/thioredoxin